MCVCGGGGGGVADCFHQSSVKECSGGFCPTDPPHTHTRIYFLKRYNTVIILCLLAQNKAHLYKTHA